MPINGANPLRNDPPNVNDLLTSDQNHDYTAEQQAFDGWKMDHEGEKADQVECRCRAPGRSGHRERVAIEGRPATQLGSMFSQVTVGAAATRTTVSRAVSAGSNPAGGAVLGAQV